MHGVRCHGQVLRRAAARSSRPCAAEHAAPRVHHHPRAASGPSRPLTRCYNAVAVADDAPQHHDRKKVREYAHRERGAEYAFPLTNEWRELCLYGAALTSSTLSQTVSGVHTFRDQYLAAVRLPVNTMPNVCCVHTRNASCIYFFLTPCSIS